MAAKKTAKSAAKKTATKAAAKPEKASKPPKSAAATPDAGPSAATAPPKPKSPGSAKPARPPLEAVARAAYLIYRRRVELGLPGDSHGDWLQAERELAGTSSEA